MHDGRFMRFNKAHPRTFAMLTEEAVPVRSDGAIALCQDCQRRVWFAGGYLEMLAKRLAALSKAIADQNRLFVSKLGALQVGESCSTVHLPWRAIEVAKAVADERRWTIHIRKHTRSGVTITRLPRKENHGGRD